MYKKLLQLVLNALNTFNPESDGIQEFITEFLDKELVTNEEHYTFVHEVFSGCVRYDSAITIVVDGYFRSPVGKQTSRMSDKNLYKALVYLTVFRLDELGAVHYRKMVLSQNISKMFKFLTFFLDESKLKTWIFTEWCKVYDHSYVQINLLSPLIKWLPELHELLIYMNDKITNKEKFHREIRSPTAPLPFNLTKSKPRSVPLPEKIPTLKKHKAVPETTYEKPKETEVLEKIRDNNRIKAEKKLIEASMNQFTCASTEKSAKTKERRRKYLEEEEEKLNFTKHKARPLPSKSDENMPIRLNAAAIMREGLLVQKKEVEENKKLSDLATGGRDMSEFLSWQQEMRRKDLEDKLADIEAKRLAGKLSYEEAILARQTLIEENRKKVQDIKKETKEMMDEYLRVKFQEQQEMRMLVENIIEGHENAKEAKLRLKKYKQSIVEQVNNESKALMRRALEEAENEMREKVALITKIRAIESVPRIRCKYVDLTETSGAGLLGEMSVAELRERLALLKIEEKKEEERKRKDIIQSKVEKNQLLIDTLESITKRRAEKGKEAAIKLEEKKNSTKREIQNTKVTELQEQLSARRAEREKFRQQSPPKSFKSKQKKLAQQKDALEELRWKELEKTREKAARLHAKTVSQSSSRTDLVTS